MKNKRVALRFNLFLFFIVIVLIFISNFAAYMIDTKNNPDSYIALWENGGEGMGDSGADKPILVNNPVPKSESLGADYLAKVRFTGSSDTLTQYLESRDGTGENPGSYYYIYAPNAEVEAPKAKGGVTVYICAKRPIVGDNSKIDRDNSKLLEIANEKGYHFIDINLPLKGMDGQLRAEYTGDYGDINEQGCAAALEWILTHTAVQ